MPELLSAETGGQSRRDHLGAATLERIQQDTTTLVLPQERTGEDLIIVDKQREGVTGEVPVRYDGHSLTYVEREG